MLEHHGQVIKSRNLDVEVRAQHDLSGALCREISWIRDHQNGAVIGSLIGKYQRLAQKALGESTHQGSRLEHLLKRDALETEIERGLVGEFASRQVRDFPGLAGWSDTGANGIRQ